MKKIFGFFIILLVQLQNCSFMYTNFVSFTSYILDFQLMTNLHVKNLFI